MENRLITCSCLIVTVVCCHCLEAAGGIQVDVDNGFPGVRVWSCMGSPHYMVKLRAVVTLKKNTLSCCAGLDIHHVHVRVKGGRIRQLSFSSLCKKDKKGCRSRDEKDVIWNEVGHRGGQGRREAALEMRKYRWSRAEVRKFDLGCMKCLLR